MASSNNSVKIVAAIVLVAVAVVLFTRQGGGPGGPLDGSAYYYDLTSGQLFPAPATSQPPIDAPGGAGKGVAAYVYACGDCAGATPIIGYLTTVTPEARAMMKKSIDEIDSSVIEQGRLIGTPPPTEGGEVQWVVDGSAAGQQIRQQVASACSGSKPVQCSPTR